MRNTWSILVLCAFGFLLVIICSGLFWFHLHWFELVDANTYYTVHIMYFSCSERKRNLFCFPTKSRSPYSRIWHHISSTYMRQFHHTLFFRSFPSTFLIFEFRENFLSPFKETAKLQIEKAIFKWTSLFLILQAWKKKKTTTMCCLANSDLARITKNPKRDSRSAGLVDLAQSIQ